jgi:hypothetical protein
MFRYLYVGVLDVPADAARRSTRAERIEMRMTAKTGTKLAPVQPGKQKANRRASERDPFEPDVERQLPAFGTSARASATGRKRAAISVGFSHVA